MKDGRTHLAHKAEHAIDLDTGAIVGITVQGADEGDTATIQETLPEAAERLEAVAAVADDAAAVIEEVVADKGYHSRTTVHDLETLEIRTYISEPDRGRQSWTDQEAERDAVYANRRRIRGNRGQRLLRRRGELLERPCAHLYQTGGHRRAHVRGHENVRHGHQHRRPTARYRMRTRPSLTTKSEPTTPFCRTERLGVITLPPRRACAPGLITLGLILVIIGLPSTGRLFAAVASYTINEKLNAHDRFPATDIGGAIARTSVSASSDAAILGQIGGATYTVSLAGRYAYVAVGHRVTVLDVLDPAHPQLVGESRPLSNGVMGIVLTGSYAYVATQAGFTILDVSMPTQPYEIGSRAGFAAMGLAVVGRYAYIAAGTDGLRIVDISNPTQIQEVGGLDTPDFSEAVVVVGNYAYVADHGSGLHIIDVSIPSNPVELGRFATRGDAWHVQVVGRYAYVADHQRGSTINGGLRIADISDPGHPVEVGSLIFGDGAHGVFVIGSYVYLARDSGRLSIIDVSNVAGPVEVGSYVVGTPGGEALKVAIANNYAFVAVGNGELHVVDITNRQIPARVSVWAHSGTPIAVAVSGGRAYVGSIGRGLRILDVSNAAQPGEIGALEIPGNPVGIAYADQRAFVVTGQSFEQVPVNPVGALRIVDVSNPAQPRELGSYQTRDFAQGVNVRGVYAYIAASQGGLQVIDVSNPTRPTESGWLDTPGTAEGVVVADSYAYVADGNAGLRIIDVSVPSQPREIGAIGVSGYCRNVMVVAGYAFVAAGEAGLKIIDVSRPSAPVEVGTYQTFGNALGVTVSAGYAYIASYGRGLRVIDVTDVSRPHETDSSLPLLQYSHASAVLGSNLLIAAADNGFVIAVAPASAPLQLTDLRANHSFPVEAGTPVTWTATATAGAAPYAFRFWVFNGTTWSIGRDWDAASSWTWEPPLPGTYTIQAWARNAGSSNAYDSWLAATASVSVPSALTVTTIQPSVLSAPAGAAVTWTATAAGGAGPYTYRFWVYDGASWRVGQEWSPANTWTWTAPTPGTYQFQVWVRQVQSSNEYDTWRAFGPYTAARPATLTVTGFTAEPASPISVGAPVTWTVSAAGGASPYSYKFFIFDGSTWAVAHDWSPSASWTWVPTSVGGYNLQVWVRNADSSATYDAWRGQGATVTAAEPFQVTRLSADHELPVPAGTPVQWIAHTRGGLGPYTYKFYVFNGSTWNIGQDWSTADHWTWLPPSAGLYSVQVWLRNGGSVTSYDGLAGTSGLAVTAPIELPLVTLSMAPMSPLFAGPPATLTATATGGAGPYAYQFWVYDGATWTIARPWSPENTFTWRPPAGGTYWVQVWVRNVGSFSLWDGWSGRGPIVVLP